MKFENDFSIAYFKDRKPIWAILETIVITILILFLAITISPNDPFSLSGPFPWIVFAPVFCSLLYGAMNGAISLVILLLYLFYQQPVSTDSFLVREYVVGMASLTLLTGIFSSYWLSRVRHVEYLNRYVREHMDEMSRDFYLLRVSHERLEHAYITKPFSFRDAFIQLKQTILNNNFEVNANVTQELLNIFSQYCSIDRAVFCFYDDKTHIITTMATLGESFPISLDDPLLHNAIENNITTYFAVNTLEINESSDYLAVIPLLNSQRRNIGFIIIKEMPFWSLTNDNLEVLTVFAATFALQFSTIKRVESLLKLFPTCTPEFLRELQTLANLKKYNKVDSAFAALLLPEGFSQKNILYSLEQQKRALDYIWTIPIGTSILFLTLMPLSSLAGIQGYKNRLSEWLKSEFGEVLNKKGYIFRYQQLNDDDVNKQLETFIKEFSHAND